MRSSGSKFVITNLSELPISWLSEKEAILGTYGVVHSSLLAFAASVFAYLKLGRAIVKHYVGCLVLGPSRHFSVLEPSLVSKFRGPGFGFKELP